MPKSTNNQPPWLGRGFPLYPQVSHVVRVYSPPILGYDSRTVNDAELTTGSDEIESLEAEFQPSDVGAALVGQAIPYGALIASVLDEAHALMTMPAVAPQETDQPILVANGAVPNVVNDGVLTAGSPVISSLTANFTDDFLGALVSSPQLPWATLIAEVNSPTEATLSQEPVASGTLQPVQVLEGTIETSMCLGYIQQLSAPLTLRDRELVVVWEPNGITLNPGYYDARLVGSYLSVPLLVTWCCP